MTEDESGTATCAVSAARENMRIKKTGRRDAAYFIARNGVKLTNQGMQPRKKRREDGIHEEKDAGGYGAVKRDH